MASYELEITRTAEKQLRRLPRSDQLRLAKAMVALADEPRPRGCRKLTGYDDVYRSRIGRYRMIYSVSKRRLVILILKISHRREVYR
jgi:mRNA interferase RelE/StbE